MPELLTIRAGHEWSYVVLDEETGLFVAHGSYGTFAHVWPPQHRSQPLREFLASLNFDYFIGKTRGLAAKEFDCDKTRARMKEWIIDARRQYSLTKKQARYAWDGLALIGNTNSSADFCSQAYNDADLYRALGSEWYEAICQSYTAECTEFWRVIWPAFLAAIKPAEDPAHV